MRHESGRVEEPRATARNAPPGPSYTWVRHTLLAALALFLLSGCGGRLHKQQSYVFGTLVEITIYGESEDHARQAKPQFQRIGRHRSGSHHSAGRLVIMRAVPGFDCG